MVELEQNIKRSTRLCTFPFFLLPIHKPKTSVNANVKRVMLFDVGEFHGETRRQFPNAQVRWDFSGESTFDKPSKIHRDRGLHGPSRDHPILSYGLANEVIFQPRPFWFDE